MRIFRLALAVLIALSVASAPAVAKIRKVDAVTAHDCLGMAKGKCHCDDGPARCSEPTCSVLCAGFLMLSVEPVGVVGAVRRQTMILDTIGLQSIGLLTEPPIPKL